MTRRTAMAAAVAAALTFAAPAAADTVPPPREKALDAYSALWHKCKDMPTCDAPRNIRRHDVRFKWISATDEKDRHWGTRPPTAADIADKIRALREDTTPPQQSTSGGYTIPAYVVQCESQGDPRAVNYSNPDRPAGLYQIITSTWLANGGGQFAPTADQATPQEQGIIAARIWDGGRGAGQWACA